VIILPRNRWGFVTGGTGIMNKNLFYYRRRAVRNGFCRKAGADLGKRAYIATAPGLDAEMAARIRHRREWRTLAELLATELQKLPADIRWRLDCLYALVEL
jgi:adenosyl cobinamide kinase/adenosyl cobinamide phosphate guanylyltransferase